MKPPRILRQVKIDGAWMKLPVAVVRGKHDWTRVKLRGELVPSPPGVFYLEYRESGRKCRRAVGTTAQEAQQAMQSQASVLELRSRGVDTGDAPEIGARIEAQDVSGPTIREAVDAFCKAPALGLRARSVTQYKHTFRSFEVWARKQKKTHLVQLGREDITGFMTHLVRVEKLAMRTAVNRSVLVLKRLRDAGAVIQMKRGDWPRVTEAQPDIYTPEMLRPLFAAMTFDELVRYQTFLMTGFRMQEVGYLSRADFNARDGTLRVSKKKGHAFDPKNYMERTVPVPPELVKLLQKHILRMEDKDTLLFGTSRRNVGRGATGGQYDKHLLLKLKKVALRAGLNCGRCQAKYEGKPVSCRTAPVCRLWTLHKFRHTYATTLLQDDYDIRTVQALLGHREIDSTMKYLHLLPAKSLRKKMDNAAIAKLFV